MNSALPEGWENKRIGELGEIVTGFTPSTTEADFWNGEIPFVSPADFTKDVYVKTTAKKVTELGASKGRMLPPNTILVTCIGSLGDIALTSKNCITNQQINSIIVNKENDAQFIFYNMQLHSGELKKLAGTTTIPIINKSTFSSIDLPIPPLPEQEKIAAVLGAVDDVIEKTALQIKKLNDLKKATMNELLTNGIGHTDFKPSELGPIPKSWEVKSCDEVCEKIIVGIATSSSQAFTDKSGIPFIRNQNIKAGRIDKSELLYITHDFAVENKSKALQVGDVISARTGHPGISGVVDDTLVNAHTFTTLISRLKKEEIDSHFYAMYLNSDVGQAQVSLLQAGGAQQNLNVEMLKTLKIPIPTLNEQRKIIQNFSILLNTLDKSSKKLSSLNALKKSLMQDLLSGKVRVRV